MRKVKTVYTIDDQVGVRKLAPGQFQIQLIDGTLFILEGKELVEKLIQTLALAQNDVELVGYTLKNDGTILRNGLPIDFKATYSGMLLKQAE